MTVDNRHTSRVKFIGFSLLLLTITMILLPALMTPIPTVLAIEMNKDFAVEQTSTTLSQNIPGAISIEYDSFKYHLLAWRTLKPVIWISHGSEEGVLIQGEIKNWSDVENLVRMTPNKDILLACHSDEILKQTSLTSADAITFNSDIDSILGALVVSYALTGNEKIVNKIIDRVSTLASNPELILPLAIVMDGGSVGGSTTTSSSSIGLSQIELGYWIIITIVFLIGVVIGWYMDPSWSFVQKLGIKLITVGKIGILTTLAYVGAGYMSWNSALPKIVGFCFDTLGYLLKALFALSWWEQLILGICLILSIIAHVAAYVATGSAVLWAKIAACVAGGIAICVGIAHDFYDNNNWVG